MQNTTYTAKTMNETTRFGIVLTAQLQRIRSGRCTTCFSEWQILHSVRVKDTHWVLINGKFFNLISVCQYPGGRRRAKYIHVWLRAGLAWRLRVHIHWAPPKVRSSQCVTKQVDRKSSMDRTGRVGLPGVTDDYPPTICKKNVHDIVSPVTHRFHVSASPRTASIQ